MPKTPVVQPIVITPNPIPHGESAVAHAENLPPGVILNFQCVTETHTTSGFAGHAGHDGVIDHSFTPEGIEKGTCTFQHDANHDTVYAEGNFTFI